MYPRSSELSRPGGREYGYRGGLGLEVASYRPRSLLAFGLELEGFGAGYFLV